MGAQELDIEEFRRWAMGNLADNAVRGVFAEWLVGQGLGETNDGTPRLEWDCFDLLYRQTRIEIKASGRCQVWHKFQACQSCEQQCQACDRAVRCETCDEKGPSKTSFNIAPKRSCWDARTDEWAECKEPVRWANIYVFCLHESIPAKSENVSDPGSWKFWVVSTKTLDEELGASKGVGLSTLNRLAEPVGWPEIKKAVDGIIG